MSFKSPLYLDDAKTAFPSLF